MGMYRNDSLGVVNVGGVFAAPKKNIEVSDDTAGLKRLVDRGVLSKVTAATASKSKSDSKQDKSE